MQVMHEGNLMQGSGKGKHNNTWQKLPDYLQVKQTTRWKRGSEAFECYGNLSIDLAFGTNVGRRLNRIEDN